MNVDALRLTREFDADLIRERYSQYSFYGDGGERTKDSGVEVEAGYFWRVDRLCVPRNSKLLLRLIYELHDNQSPSHKGVVATLAKALGRLWWKRIRQDLGGFCERRVVHQQAYIQAQMSAIVHPSHVPPRQCDVYGTWHALGLDYLDVSIEGARVTETES
jgi:hypothetical protein